MLEQQSDLEAHVREAQEEALRQLEESRNVVHTQADAITREARDALEKTTEASLAAVVQSAASTGTRLDTDAGAKLLKRVSGERVEKPQAYSASVTDALHAAALEQAAQPTQDESAREECHARARAPVSDGWVSPCWRNNELLPAGLLRHKNLTVEIPAACFAWIRTQQVEIDPLLLLIICGL